MAQIDERIAKLSAAQRQLLQARIRAAAAEGGGGNRAAGEPFPCRRPDEPIPASSAQRQLWFLSRLSPHSPAYNLGNTIHLRGALDTRILRDCLNQVVRRHESLRMQFEAIDGEPHIRLLSGVEAALPTIDLGALPVGQRMSQASRRATELARQPLDLGRGPLLRAALFRLDEADHILVLVVHHVVSDRWSLALFINELLALYDAAVAGTPAGVPALHIGYTDFAVWQRRAAQQAMDDEHRAYWQRALGDCPANFELPTDRPRPAVQTDRGATYVTELPAELTRRLDEMGRARGATPFMVLLAGFEALLYRHTQQSCVVVGTPMAGRGRAELENLIGLFAHVLPIRADVGGQQSFSELLDQARARVLELLAHQSVPLDRLVEALRVPRDPARSPLFQIIFNYHNVPAPPARRAGLSIDVGDVQVGTARFDLTVTLRPQSGGSLRASFEYNSDLFDALTISRLAEHYRVLLDGAVTAPHTPIDRLPLLSEAERHEELVEWNAESAVGACAACAHATFERQAQRTPDAVALVDGSARLTYAQLNDRANRLAHHLRALGAGPEKLVAVCLRRTARLAVALLGILKSGAAYVPLDPAYPLERLAYMLEDSAAPILLSERAVLDSLPLRAPRVVCLDRDAAVIANQDGADPTPLAGPQSLAYVIYTSGSTGKPKGVCIEHRGPASLVAWANAAIPDRQTAGMLFSTSACFDLSVFELLVPLSRGGKLILVENALYLPACPARDEVTFINSVPSVMAELLRLSPLPRSVRAIGLAGEPLPLALARQCYACEGVEHVYNLYGPTEDTVYSTAHRVARDSDRAPAIGRPIGGTVAYILDDHLQPVPAGLSGELYLGGAKLARGYLNRPELTQERFVTNPLGAQPPTLYRTGDLCRYDRTGVIEFICRRDYQVKLRGFRIELGEIEAVLGKHPQIRQCAVIVAGDGEQRRLAAFVGSPGQHKPAARDLRAHLAAQLPQYMIPSAFVVADALPLTPNGKIDRKALAGLLAPAVEPDAGTPDSDSSPTATSGWTAPQTPTQQALAAIWSDLLRADHVGLDDNFFELGGHSLRAVALIARIQQRFGVELALRSVFEHPTIRKLGQWIDQRLISSVASPAPAPRADGDAGEPTPLAPAQLRLWFLSRLERDLSTYNVPVVRRLSGPLDVPRLEPALGEVVRRHEILRTVFPDHEGIPRQMILPPGPVRIEIIDVCDDSDPQRQDARLATLIADDARHQFDLARGPLWRMRLLRLGTDQHLLLLNLHHIICDDWSIRLLFDELSRLYAGGPQATGLPQLPWQYRDFARWQQQWLAGDQYRRELAYWRGQLQAAPAMLALPTDRPRPVQQTFRGQRQTFELPADVASAAAALARQQGMTLFMVLLGLFDALLMHWTGQHDIVVGTPIANRDRGETHPMIGLCLNTLPIRVDLGGEPTTAQLLARVKQAALGAYAHANLPFERLIEELRPPRHLGCSPLFQVMFVLLNQGRAMLDLPGVRCQYVPSDSGTAKFDLTMLLTEHGDGPITGTLEYNADLFDASTICDLAAQYVQRVGQAVRDPQQPLERLVPADGGAAQRRGPGATPEVIGQQQGSVRPQYLAPRDDTERALVEIWQEVLGIDRIGVDDDFFEIGGQSLLAARVFAKIENRLGRALPLNTLFAAPTIAQLAQNLAGNVVGAVAEGHDGIVVLQRHGTRPPLMCISGKGGHVFGFRQLAAHLAPDVPVYGLELDGVDMKRAAIDRVEDAAAAIVQRMLRSQTHGAFHLVGYSYGGLVAYEVAQQLVAAGQRVALLVLIDAFVPAAFRPRPLPIRMFLHARHMVARGVSGMPDYCWQRVLSLLRRAGAVRAAARPAETMRAAQTEQGTAVARAIERVERASLHAYRAYQPRPYHGRVVLFRAAQRPTWYDFVCTSALNGWDELVEDGIDLRLVPGAHQTLLEEPSVQHVARMLRQYLSAGR